MIPWISLIIMSGVALLLVAIIIGLKARYVRLTEEARERANRLRAELHAVRKQLPIDPATGLANYRQLEDDWARLSAWHRRSGDPFTFVAVRVTDAGHFGEPLEPAVMRDLAQQLFELARTEDHVYRLDVDTFGFLLTGARAEGAKAFVERIERELTKGVTGSDGQPVFLDVLAGAAEWTEELGTLQGLIEAAVQDATVHREEVQAARHRFETADYVP